MIFCETCKRNFSQQQKLNYHMKNVKCKLTCYNCLTEFENQGNYNRHIEEVDCKKRYRCQECETIYTLKRKYEKHIKLHKKYTKSEQKIYNNCNVHIYNGDVHNRNNVNNNNVNNVNNSQQIQNNLNVQVKKKPRKKREPAFMKENPLSIDCNFCIDHISEEQMEYYRSLDRKYDDKTLFEYMYGDCENLSKEVVHDLDKLPVIKIGTKLFFKEILKNPVNRNVRERKKKSGKLYVYQGEWKEKKSKPIKKKISHKLNRQLYDISNITCQYNDLIMRSQPDRYKELFAFLGAEIQKLNSQKLLEN
jgi:hypothetical protein